MGVTWPSLASTPRARASSNTLRVSWVSTSPGRTALTRTPVPAQAFAFVRGICDQRRCDPAFSADCRRRFLGVARPANHQHRSAFARETDRTGATDAAAAAGHDRALAL